MYQFGQALIKGGEAELPATAATTIDESMADGKKQTAAKKQNMIAMANLTMCFMTEATMGMAYTAMSTVWPRGLAHKVASVQWNFWINTNQMI